MKIAALTRCEISAVVRFLNGKESSAAQVYRKLHLVYRSTVVSEEKVKLRNNSIETSKMVAQMCMMIKNRVADSVSRPMKKMD